MKSADPSSNFGMVPEDLSEYEKSKVVVLPVPYGSSSTYLKGTEKAPEAVISASQNMELYDLELGNICEAGICTLEGGEYPGPEKMVDEVHQAYSKLIDDKKFVVAVGGEHTISLPCVRALKEKHPKLSVLQFDAHADLRDEYEKSKYSHACVMKRISEVTDFVGVGIRSMSEDEAELIKEKSLKEYYAKDLLSNKSLFDEAIESLSDEVYITIDMDVLDPAIVSVGTPEPGGLGWYDILDFLKKTAEKKKIVGFDIAELLPDPKSDFLAAKLIYKLIGYSLS